MLTWDSATPEQKMEIVTLARGFDPRDKERMLDFGMVQLQTLLLLHEKSRAEMNNIIRLLNDYSTSADETIDVAPKTISVASLFSLLRVEQEIICSAKRLKDMSEHLSETQESYALHVCAAEYALAGIRKGDFPADDLRLASAAASRLRTLADIPNDLENDGAVHDMLRQFVDRVGVQTKVFRRLSSPAPGATTC